MHNLPKTLTEYVCNECGQMFYSERKTESLCCPECGSMSYINEEDIKIQVEEALTNGKGYKTAEELHKEIINSGF